MFANLCKVFLCVFHFSKALECYRCDNGKTEADCQQTTLCSIDQNMCYTEVRNTWDGEVSIMKSCYQDLACQTLVSQNGHNCPNVCAICCSGDLCNTRGPEFCSCEILTTTTIATTPPPTTTTETTRTTTTTAKTTTLNTARPTTRTTSSATNPMTTEIQNTTQAELETTTAARITDTTQDACTELKDIPLASTKLLCDEGNFTSCMSSNHSPIIVLDNDEYTINHKPSTTYNCRKLQSDTTVNLGTTSSSMTLSCVKLHPSASTTTVVNLEPSQPNYEGNLTIYCDFEDIFSDSLIEALPNPCNPTYIRCFVIFYPASLPGFTPTEATQSSEVTQTIEVTQAVKDVLSSSSQGVAVWLIIVIAIACTIAVVVSFVFLYKATSSPQPSCLMRLSSKGEHPVFEEEGKSSKQSLRLQLKTLDLFKPPCNNNNRVGISPDAVTTFVEQPAQYMEPYPEEDWLKRWPYYLQIQRALSKCELRKTL